MREQTSLHPPYSREATSHDAAHQIEDHTPTLRERVYTLISLRNGITDEEIAEHLGLEMNTARPRRWELERQGLIYDSGVRRKTKSGRAAILWVIAEQQMILL